MRRAPISTSCARVEIEGLARLMTLAFEGVDLRPLAARLIERAAANDADALMDLSIVLQLQGLRVLGMAVHAHALQIQRLYEVRASKRPRMRLLAIAAPGDIMTNTPVEFLIKDSDVSLTVLYLAANEPVPLELPAHDAVFIAVAYSEPILPLLAAIEGALRSWGGRVLNLPSRIPRTARTEAFKILAAAPGIFIPQTARTSRSELTRVATGESAIDALLVDAAFPIIVRPVDSHAGHGLERVDAPGDIERYLSKETAEEFFVSRFIDYRGDDGMFRKYRIVLIDGIAFPGHMGISAHWMIHYLNAGMVDSETKRREEERFMNEFRTGFGAQHAAALDAIAERFGLDYLVIDCGETIDGELLVFEVCTGAVVHAMDPVDLFPYKRRHMDEIFAAFRALLIRSATVSPASA
jgi:hypothetical protein